MMTVKQLKSRLRSIPDDAIVYVRSDHGQQSNMAGYISFSNEEYEKPMYYGEDLDWEHESPKKDVKFVLLT